MPKRLDTGDADFETGPPLDGSFVVREVAADSFLSAWLHRSGASALKRC